jgi:hypothetical protein
MLLNFTEAHVRIVGEIRRKGMMNLAYTLTLCYTELRVEVGHPQSHYPKRDQSRFLGMLLL